MQAILHFKAGNLISSVKTVLKKANNIISTQHFNRRPFFLIFCVETDMRFSITLADRKAVMRILATAFLS